MTIQTAAYVVKALQDADWPQGAIAVAVKLGSHARHEERVRVTLRAVKVEGILDGSQERRLPALLVAWGLLEVDLRGYGGPHGVGTVGGDCTTRRLPHFKECGKGRKRASDGEAWMAAATDAQKRVVEALYLWKDVVDPNGVTPWEPPRIVADGHELGISWEGVVINPPGIPQEWVVGACKRALWLAFRDGDVPALTPELKEWAELLVAASAAGPGAFPVVPGEEEPEVIPAPPG